MQTELAVYADKVCCVCEQSSRCMQAEPAVNTLEKYTQRSIHSEAYTAKHTQQSINSDSIHSEAFTAQHPQRSIHSDSINSEA